jgi:hypothetical protein
VEGCDCCQGPAQRDDLADIITDQSEFLEKVKNKLNDINRRYLDPTCAFPIKDVGKPFEELWKEIVSFLASMDKRIRHLE